jgi:hypothetical protein
MTDLPTAIPVQLRAGDTLRWRRSLPDYPATAGWALAYTLITATSVHAIATTADGDDHVAEALAADTDTWPAGAAQLVEYATNGADRVTLNSLPVRVLPDLAVAVAGTDLRSHARKMLDAIEAWLESEAPVAGMVEIAGRRIQHYPLPDLLALRDRYRAELAREEALAAGTKPSRLLVRFA